MTMQAVTSAGVPSPAQLMNRLNPDYYSLPADWRLDNSNAGMIVWTYVNVHGLAPAQVIKMGVRGCVTERAVQGILQTVECDAVLSSWRARMRNTQAQTLASTRSSPSLAPVPRPTELVVTPPVQDLVAEALVRDKLCKALQDNCALLPALPPLPGLATEEQLLDAEFAGFRRKGDGSVKTIQRWVIQFHPSLSREQEETQRHESLREMLGERRLAEIVTRRQEAMWLCKTVMGTALPEIGRRFGGRDHTTVLHAVRKYNRLIDSNAVLAARLVKWRDNLMRLLASQAGGSPNLSESIEWAQFLLVRWADALRYSQEEQLKNPATPLDTSEGFGVWCAYRLLPQQYARQALAVAKERNEAWVDTVYTAVCERCGNDDVFKHRMNFLLAAVRQSLLPRSDPVKV